VKSKFHPNRSDGPRLPKGPIYEPMRAEAECAIRAEHFPDRTGLEMWLEQVLVDLLTKDSPVQVWREVGA
jgi:hypothetical protein